MKKINKSWVSAFAAATLFMGCAGNDDSCVDTFADGEDYSTSSTCPGKTAPPEVTALPDADPANEEVCTETFAYQCSDPSDPTTCEDVYEKVCPSGLVEKTLEPGCRLVGSTTSRTLGEFAAPIDQLGVFSTDRSTRITTNDPWFIALTKFNSMLSVGSPVIKFSQQRFTGQGRLPVLQQLIRSFSVSPNGVVSAFPDAAGLATCSSTIQRGRHNCTIQIIMENVRKYAAITGFAVADVTKTVALHELGHVACIQHLSSAPGTPTTGPTFTAMNNIYLTDNSQPISRYFTYDSTEIADVRTAFINGFTIPSTNIVGTIPPD